uniref:Vascular endothelial growth factor receptor 1 n=1 Tax=Timema shepardi TaxID=629360 RepID=A0A7R9ATL0_TIMSH|nr:unnamed protein product [Timema shepardi]
MNLPFLRVQQHGDVLLPCRPSSPDVKIELLKDGEVVDNISLKEENVEIDYDPTEGITLHHIDIKHSGDYECIASLGNSESTSLTVTIYVLFNTESVPKPMMTDIDEMHVEVGDNVNLICWVDMGPSIGFSMEWTYPNKNENNSTIFYSDLEWNNTFWESKLNILAQSSGQLLCYANNKRGESNHSINFLVTDIGNEDQFSVWGPENPIEGDDVRLHCGGVVSNFSSDISWFRTELNDKKEHTITDDTDLQAPFFIDTNMNETNWYNDSRTTIQWKCLVGGTPQPVITWYKKLRKEMTVAGLIHFEEGAMDNMNPELPLDEQAKLLPYDKKWEFPRDKLKLGKQLGAGAFGVVMKAEAWGIIEGETVSTVAVKMVKKNADYTYLKALAHRDHFIDQIDMKTGQIDPSIGSDILARAAALSAKTKLKYAALSFSNNSGENSCGEDYKSTSGYLEPRSPGIVPSSPGLNSDMTFISMTPTGEDSMMLSNNSSQPEWRSNVRGDYKPSHVRPICTRDLLCWAFQVARGMEYLVGRKVLHGDLAARNILLADDNIVKICDFGLAKSMYKSDNYKKKGDGPLPVKWMAVESIRDRIFSTQSDVWSFGIVLWEFFSLARTPYPGMEADEKLYNKLVDGYRMECPDYATKEIYKIMVECWKAHPTHRPTFTKLSEMLGDMMEESVRNLANVLVVLSSTAEDGEIEVSNLGQHYIDLNNPYIDMNMIQLEGHSDYLSMMTAPTYGNLVSPSYEGHEHHYVNNPGEANRMAQEAADENPGYLCMKSPHPLVNDSVIFSPRTGTISGNIFQFGTPPGQKKMRNTETRGASPELKPMLRNGSESDVESPSQINNLNNLNQGATMRNDAEPMKEMKITNDLKLGQTIPGQTPSFLNPNYQSTIPLKPSPDNYINMPQHRLEENMKRDKLEDAFLQIPLLPPSNFTWGEGGGCRLDIPGHGRYVTVFCGWGTI